MTRRAVFSLSFIFLSLVLIIPSIVSAGTIQNEMIYLSAEWHESNSVYSWSNLDFDFGDSDPVGRMSLAFVDMESNGIEGEILTNVFKWQFMDNQPIELINLTVNVNNPENKKLNAYLNTEGVWKKVSSKTLSQTQVEFQIQSMEGMMVISGTEKQAEDEFNELFVDAATVVKGYTYDSPDKNIRIGFMPDLVDKPFTAKVRTLSNFYGASDLPEELNFASDIYHIWIDSDEPLDLQKPIPVQLKFLEGNDELKNIYYYDPATRIWNHSPSTTLYDLGSVRTLTYHQEYILAVVSDPTKKEYGVGSWFPSSLTPRNVLGSANNDYPIGTVVRVTNLDNQKYYDTEIISRGPYVDFRIIDLTSEAFKKIASLGAGVINVKIEPIDMIIK